MGEESGDRGFKVVDRRSFDRDGSERDESAESPGDRPDEPSQGAGAGAPTEGASGGGEPRPEPADDGDDALDADAPLPEMDFVTFVLSLHNSAACLLGKAPYPDTGQCSVNLPMAKQTIDILGMLQDKTKGNLSGEEERILSEILYDLRMAYVQAAK